MDQSIPSFSQDLLIEDMDYVSESLLIGESNNHVSQHFDDSFLSQTHQNY